MTYRITQINRKKVEFFCDDDRFGGDFFNIQVYLNGGQSNWCTFNEETSSGTSRYNLEQMVQIRDAINKAIRVMVEEMKMEGKEY